VAKLFFNKGLISGLILLGQGDEPIFFSEKYVQFFTHFFGQKIVAQNFLPQ
jgi:hypothetical protein